MKAKWKSFSGELRAEYVSNLNATARWIREGCAPGGQPGRAVAAIIAAADACEELSREIERDAAKGSFMGGGPERIQRAQEAFARAAAQDHEVVERLAAVAYAADNYRAAEYIHEHKKGEDKRARFRFALDSALAAIFGDADHRDAEREKVDCVTVETTDGARWRDETSCRARNGVIAALQRLAAEPGADASAIHAAVGALIEGVRDPAERLLTQNPDALVCGPSPRMPADVVTLWATLDAAERDRQLVSLRRVYEAARAVARDLPPVSPSAADLAAGERAIATCDAIVEALSGGRRPAPVQARWEPDAAPPAAAAHTGARRFAELTARERKEFLSTLHHLRTSAGGAEPKPLTPESVEAFMLGLRSVDLEDSILKARESADRRGVVDFARWTETASFGPMWLCYCPADPSGDRVVNPPRESYCARCFAARPPTTSTRTPLPSLQSVADARAAEASELVMERDDAVRAADECARMNASLRETLAGVTRRDQRLTSALRAIAEGRSAKPAVTALEALAKRPEGEPTPPSFDALAASLASAAPAAEGEPLGRIADALEALALNTAYEPSGPEGGKWVPETAGPRWAALLNGIAARADKPSE